MPMVHSVTSPMCSRHCREDRLLVWSQVAAEQAGDVFVAASDGVRKFLIAETDERKSVADALDELRARGELPSC